MKEKISRKNKKISKSPIFLIALLNFLIIVFVLIYMVYLRFIPYETIEYSGYAVSGKQLLNNLLNTNFDVEQAIDALEVNDQDEVYQNFKSFYIGTSKEKNINLDYPIYVNDNLALYNLSKNTMLINSDLQLIDGYAGFTLTSGALYNANTMARADYHDYVLMKNADGMYINTKDIEVKTSNNKYKIKNNSIINFTDKFITYYTLKDGKFIYGKILDVDLNSKVIVKDYNRDYSYKQFLIGLDIIPILLVGYIIRDDTKNKQEENETKENKIKDEKENTENKTSEQQENNINENNKSEDDSKNDNSNDNTGEGKWQKPTVSCTDFVPNVYTAVNQINISDPSGAINKALTFSFYVDEEIQFRASAISSGEFRVSGLLPDTKYKVIGKYQYINEDGGIIEVKFFEQEFSTFSIKNIKEIELDFKNGQIYSNKIELKDLKIVSDLNDEAIFGVSKAEIIVNDVPHFISEATLRKLLQGNTVEAFYAEGIDSNTKCKYEIAFYDAAGNKMKLKNNTGATVTLKETPNARVRLTKQNITSVELEITLENTDDVELFNYRYVIINGSGKIYKKDNLSIKKVNTLYFNDFDPNTRYRIKVYADFDVEDGNGFIEDRIIGEGPFDTIPLSELGSLKFKIDYKNQDIMHDIIRINASIDKNSNRTDPRLISILTSVNILLLDDSNNLISEKNITDIFSLTNNKGEEILFENLNSNTHYNINITATAKQGTVEEEVKTSFTQKSITTKKSPIELYKKNVVVTKDTIDFDVMLFDKDGISLNSDYIIEFRNLKNNNLIEERRINTNEWSRCTFTELKMKNTYKIAFIVDKYNNTNNSVNTKKDQKIDEVEYTTEGLEGNIDLIGLLRKKDSGKNIIDVESENNWYSKCFDVIETNYEGENNKNFTITSNRNYGKVYNSDTHGLTLTRNQCYVYDFSEYRGKQVTMSFQSSSENKVYIQKGKNIGNETILISNLNKTSGVYRYTTIIPQDGYLGFYLEGKGEVTIINLQVELGDTANNYEDYAYNLKTYIKTDFESENYKLYDPENENRFNKYYIRILKENEDGVCNIGQDKEYEAIETKEQKKKSYQLNKEEKGIYKIQLLVKLKDVDPIREYVLNEIEFKYDGESYKEVKSIESKEQFLDIQPNGNYILLNNIDLIENETKSEYTFGNPNITFNGSIDFNGKTISKDVYSNKIVGRTTSYIFYTLSNSAQLKNIVLDFNINSKTSSYNIDEKDGIYSLFLYNEGNINNILLRLMNCDKQDMRYIGLIGYKNEGTIEKFIVNTKSTLYGTQDIAGCTLYTTGTIQNGYIYGKGIKVINDIPQAENSTRKIAGLTCNADNGIIQNVYNISPIQIEHLDRTNSYAANIAYKLSKDATMRNVYSTGEFKVDFEGIKYNKLLDYTNKEVNLGPNVIEQKGEASDSYYMTGITYEYNNYNYKQDITRLMSHTYQNNVLNANNYNEFISNDKTKAYYPHLRLNDCMPIQDDIKIEESKSSNVDILTSKIVKPDEYKEIGKGHDKYNEIQEKLSHYNLDDENVSLVELNIYNPSGRHVTSMTIDYVDTDILEYQKYDDNISKIYAIVYNPTTCIYKYDYNISSITSSDITGDEKTIEFGKGKELGERKINLSFVKYITSEDEWSKIGVNDENGVSGLIQNYKIKADLDFKESTYKATIYSRFEGRLDGQGHTISNINTKNGVFKSASGLIQNLIVENLDISDEGGRSFGFIARTNKSLELNNIHIKNINFSLPDNVLNRMGGLIGHCDIDNGYYYSVKIMDCSVNGLNIRINGTGNTQASIGGIVGESSITKIEILNSFAQNLNIKTRNVKLNGIGGIIGYTWNNTSEIDYCYSHGNINSDGQRIGGIFGKAVYRTSVKHCYSLVNIIVNTNSSDANIGGIGGFACKTNTDGTYDLYYPGQINTYKYNLYLGNTYSNNEIENSRRIIGNVTEDISKDPTNPYYNYINNNYGYKEQLINGINQQSGNFLFSTEELFEEDTYRNILDFGDNYNYGELENGILPKLWSSNKEYILPNQNDLTLSNEEINIISFESKRVDNENKVEIQIKVDDEDKNIELSDLTFEDENKYMETTGNISKEYLVENGNKYTLFKCYAEPKIFTDKYMIKSILFSKGGNEVQLNYQNTIDIIFYKEINNSSDWENISTETAENYKLKSNIYLGDITDKNKITKKLINRLEKDGTEKYIISGKKSQNDNSVTELNYPLIRIIKTNIENIGFENIKIESQYTSDIGLISQCSAPMNDCTFENIEINARNYIGIVSRFAQGSSANGIEIKKVRCNGGHGVGAFAGCVQSSGTFKNIKATYISITASEFWAGGIFGFFVGSLNNAQVYQYNEDTVENGWESDYLVQGTEITGGCIGYTESSNINNIKVSGSSIKGTGKCGGCIGQSNNSKTLINITSSNNIISSEGSSSGGCIGHSVEYTEIANITSENNEITGKNEVGGCIGYEEYRYGYTHYIKNIVSTNNRITGENEVGGCYGKIKGGKLNKITSSENTISGQSNIGGCIGLGEGLVKISNAKTCYEQKNVTPNISASGDYCGGIVGKHNNDIVGDGIDNYAIDGAYVYNANIRGENFVGGASGYSEGTVYAVAVDNTDIYANQDNAGGILGFYTGSSSNVDEKINANAEYFLRHSFCTNSNIRAINNAGGLVGNFVYGDIQYCYVGKTSVIAISSNAGGLVGYLDNNEMTKKQKICKIRYCFIANEPNSVYKITGTDGTGGLIGTINKELVLLESDRKTITNNLVVTDIYASSNVSMGIGKVQSTGSTARNQKVNMEKLYIFNGSYINKNGSHMLWINDEEECNIYDLLDSSQLNNSNTFTENTILNFRDSNNRYEFTSGYFPRLNILTELSVKTYWDSENLNVTQEEIEIPQSNASTTSIAMQAAKPLNMTTTSIKDELPEVDFYAIDVDKINIEFSKITPFTYFDIKTTDGKYILERTKIDERVYTLQYDFNTPLTISVSNLSNWYIQEINKENTQNLLSIIDNEYFYLLGSALYSSKKTFDEEFINIYNENALSSDGNIYNILTKELIKNGMKEIKLLETQIPITENEYEGVKVETFYHCSRVLQDGISTYRDQQLFIKNGNLYVANGNLNSIGDSIIIDSYNGKEYQTILGKDNIIYDLMTKINYPSNFKNENIIDMTNNINDNSNIVLVYYSSGKVIGFNYITGDEVFNNNVQEPKESILSYLVKSLSPKYLQYTPKRTDYGLAQDLTYKLEKVPIEQAIIEINGKDTTKNEEFSTNATIDNDVTNTTQTITSNNYSTEKNVYVTAYNPKTKKYVVYNQTELLSANIEHVESENEKINKNSDLITYYSNISTSKIKLKDIGILIIATILITICIILVMMQKRNIVRKRKR